MNKSANGYIGILIIFIGVAVIVFLMAKQYQEIGIRERDRLKKENVSIDSSTGYTNISPIDRAIDAKSTLETRDRGILGR